MEIHEQIQDDEPCEMQDMLPSDILSQIQEKAAGADKGRSPGMIQDD